MSLSFHAIIENVESLTKVSRTLEDVLLMWLRRWVKYNYCFPPAPLFKALISGQPHRPRRRKQVLSVAELLWPLTLTSLARESRFLYLIGWFLMPSLIWHELTKLKYGFCFSSVCSARKVTVVYVYEKILEGHLT